MQSRMFDIDATRQLSSSESSNDFVLHRTKPDILALSFIMSRRDVLVRLDRRRPSG